MYRYANILVYNARNRLNNNLLNNVLSVGVVVCLMVLLVHSYARYHAIIVCYLFVFTTLSDLSVLDKNVNLSVMIDFPLTIREVVDVLSIKFVASNSLLGILLLSISRLFLNFSLYEWLGILVIVTYLSLTVYLIVQLLLRKRLVMDMLISAFIAFAVVVLSVILAILFSHFPLILFSLDLVVIILYHTAISRYLSVMALKSIYVILEHA